MRFTPIDLVQIVSDINSPVMDIHLDLVRFAGNDLMVQVPFSMPHRALVDLMGNTTLQDFLMAMTRVGLPFALVASLDGEEDRLIRVDKDQIIIRLPGESYNGTWGSAPVDEILGRGAWKRGVDQSLRSLADLEQHVRNLCAPGPVQDAMLAMVKVGKASRATR